MHTLFKIFCTNNIVKCLKCIYYLLLMQACHEKNMDGAKLPRGNAGCLAPIISSL